jgi:L-seryl-tRNA(Ser) seleniumtransferase
VSERLRALPAVDRLAAAVRDAAPGTTDAEAVAVARATLSARRAALLAGAQDDPDLIADARARLRPAQRRVLNATGVVVHTNLGRAPLARAAVEALARTAGGFVDLELDLATGERGGRGAGAVALLCELTGAQDALVVNNGAGAALLAVAALAGAGGTVVVSRGQLVEIGGGFRVPEVVEQAGARLVEVGTTNRTHLEDFRRALDAHPGAIVLRVHPSNFRTLGFVAEVGIEQLCELGVPVVDDVGSGVLAGGPAVLVDEPDVRSSVRAGAALVACSGDKLLGGPQAGLLVGRADAIARARRHPLARALRAGRLPLAALEATLALHRDPERARREIPVLRMLDLPADELERRAEVLAAATGGTVVDTVGRVGGGALPLAELPGRGVALDGPDPGALAAALRDGDPAVVARVTDGRLVLDPRTLEPDDLPVLAAAVRAALED